MTANRSDNDQGEASEQQHTSSHQKRHQTSVTGTDKHIYDQVVSKSCVNVASGTHRLFKTGGTGGTSLPRSRRDLYPTLYQNDEQVQEKLDYYATTVPKSHSIRLPEEQSEDITMQDDDCSSKSASGTTSESVPPTPSDNHPASNAAAATSMPPRNSQFDIWGKIPLKEDPQRLALCHICGRRVGTLRFASHLDKCMGLGSTTRTAATHAASTIQASMRTSHHGGSF